MPSIEWFQEPRQIWIPLSPEQIKPMPLGHDTLIVIDIGGRQHNALIPSSTIRDSRYAPATIMVMNRDRLILHFPVSNEGRPAWEITQDELDRILLEE